jgi:hypothetical protein
MQDAARLAVPLLENRHQRVVRIAVVNHDRLAEFCR